MEWKCQRCGQRGRTVRGAARHRCARAPRAGRRNPNYEPPNSTIHSRRKSLVGMIGGCRRRIGALQTQVRYAAERARDIGCSYAFSRLARVQAVLTDLARECEAGEKEVWS